MKLDYHARKDFVRDLWRMFVLYAGAIRVTFHSNTVVIEVHTKQPVEVDGVEDMYINDWNRYMEVPRGKDVEVRELES
jgi:hypothetical protein